MFKFKKGFTLIELLVVIAVIGVLAVAVLSSINPIEQINKAKDTASKSDASEFLNAAERYYATFGCYPWDVGSGTACPIPYAPTAMGATAIGTMDTTLAELETKNELKTQFRSRTSSQDSITGKNSLIVSTDASNLTHVCFLPSSKTFLGQANGDATGGTGTTHVCVP